MAFGNLKANFNDDIKAPPSTNNNENKRDILSDYSNVNHFSFDIPSWNHNSLKKKKMSKETIDAHVEIHTKYKIYINEMWSKYKKIFGDDCTLVDLINKYTGKMSHYATEVDNHNIFWKSIHPNGGDAMMKKMNRGGKKICRLYGVISDQFAGFDKFKESFKQYANDIDTCGWIWFVGSRGPMELEPRLRIIVSIDGESPRSKTSARILFGIDMWEHAYYLDWRDNREGYIDNFFKNIINWEYINKKFEQWFPRIDPEMLRQAMGMRGRGRRGRMMHGGGIMYIMGPHGHGGGY